jgi:hypothetical protein
MEGKEALAGYRRDTDRVGIEGGRGQVSQQKRETRKEQRLLTDRELTSQRRALRCRERSTTWASEWESHKVMDVPSFTGFDVADIWYKL